MAETNSYSRGAHPSQRRYPPELRERAVRMVQQAIQESGERFGGQCCVASGPEQAEDATSADQMAMVSSSNAIATRRFGGFSTASS